MAEMLTPQPSDLRTVAASRIVCQFSCGAASAVATKLALADGARKRTEVVWLNPACSAALHRSRGGLFAEVAA